MKALDVGMNDLVSKPLDVTSMFAIIGSWFDNPKYIEARPLEPEQKAPSQFMATKIQSFKSIDAAKALQAVQGNVALDVRLLKRFADSQSNFDVDTDKCIQVQEWADARLLAHSLTGVAGNLGATDLSGLARQLELLCVQQTPLEDISAVQLLLRDSLGEFLVEIDELLEFETIVNTQSAAGESVDASRKRIEIILDELRPMLEKHDSLAMDLVEKLADLLVSAPSRDRFRALIEAIECFDFADAKIAYEDLVKFTNLGRSILS